MNVRHQPRRNATEEGESNADRTHPGDGREHVDAGRVESTSTRVLLQSNSALACDSCEGAIRQGTRYKCVTVRHGPGDVSELHFCDEDCLASLLDRRDPTPSPA